MVFWRPGGEGGEGGGRVEGGGGGREAGVEVGVGDESLLALPCCRTRGGREGGRAGGCGDGACPGVAGGFVAPEPVDDTHPREEHGLIPDGIAQIGEEEEEGRGMEEEGEGEGEGVLPEEEGGEEEEADVVLFWEPGAETVGFLIAGEPVPVVGSRKGEEEEEGAEEEEEEEVEGSVVVEGVAEVRGESCCVGTGNSDGESIFGKASVFHAGGVENDGEQAKGEGGGRAGGREGVVVWSLGGEGGDGVLLLLLLLLLLLVFLFFQRCRTGGP